MPIDRAAVLRNAEKLLRLGKLDGALAEYVRVVDDQPDDWSTANILGDLYLRAGQSDKGVELFVRIADSLAGEGFLPKAAALYKKILKIRPGDEHALLQAGEIAARQGVLVDARTYLSALTDGRTARGDAAGAAAVRTRLFDMHLAAGDLDRAHEYAVTAAERQALFRAFAARGDVGTAADLLTAETAGGHPDLLLALAKRHLEAGAADEALASFRQALNLDPSRGAAIADVAWSLAASAPDLALRVVEVVAETAIIEANWAGAAAWFQQLVARVPDHVPALQRLAETCFDGGLEAAMYVAQSRLVEAYLAAGSAAQARVVAEDLIAREPDEPLHVEQLRRTLVMLGEYPDSIVADRHPPAERAEEPIELDLSSTRQDVRLRTPAEPAPPDLDEVFRGMREEWASGAADGRNAYERGVALRDSGRLDESIASFRDASRDPRWRFESARALAHIYQQRRNPQQSIEWLERAAQSPAPGPDEVHALFYELAEVLETQGEVERALAVCLELQADAGQYRDVAERIRRLTRVQA